jgi:hypothetical protein
VFLQRLHAAHIGRHYRADRRDQDNDDRERYQRFDDREARIAALLVGPVSW